MLLLSAEHFPNTKKVKIKFDGNQGWVCTVSRLGLPSLPVPGTQTSLSSPVTSYLVLLLLFWQQMNEVSRILAGPHVFGGEGAFPTRGSQSVQTAEPTTWSCTHPFPSQPWLHPQSQLCAVKKDGTGNVTPGRL